MKIDSSTALLKVNKIRKHFSMRVVYANINLLPPSDAVRKQKKNILEDLFSSV